jgi:hypothetical protein
MNRPFTLPLALPRGPEHYWKLMQAHGPRGFAIQNIALCCDGAAFATVKAYVRYLLKDGHIVKIGEKKNDYGNTAHVYAVKKRLRAAPVMRREEFTGARGKIQQQCWTAMRTLGTFSIAELAASASIEESPVKSRTAETYIRRLAKAGAVEIVSPYKKGEKAPQGQRGSPGAKAGAYRLKRSADSGPLALKIFNASIVFDPNKNRLLGEAVIEEARS